MRGRGSDRSNEPGKVRPAIARKLSKKSSFFQKLHNGDYGSDASTPSDSDYGEEGGGVVVDNDDAYHTGARRSDTADLRKLFGEQGSSAHTDGGVQSDQESGSETGGTSVPPVGGKAGRSIQRMERKYRTRHHHHGSQEKHRHRHRRPSAVSVALRDMDGAAAAIESLRQDGGIRSEGSDLDLADFDISDYNSSDNEADSAVRALARQARRSKAEPPNAGSSAAEASAGKPTSAAKLIHLHTRLKPTRSKQQMHVLSAHQEAKRAAAALVMAKPAETPTVEVTNPESISPAVVGEALPGDYTGLAASSDAR